MDCMEGMKTFPDKYFDLAIVDPPYGIGNFVQTTGNIRGKKVEWNNAIPPPEYFIELKRISKHQIIWGANYFNCFNGKMGAIVWVKNQPMPNFSKAEIASCSIHQKTEVIDHTWTNFVNSKETSHPCERPIYLYSWILHNYAKPDFKIIDTHVGSASSIIAFLDFGCEWIGFEIDEDYHRDGSKRIEIHKKRPKPFITDGELANKNTKQKGFFDQ